MLPIAKIHGFDGQSNRLCAENKPIMTFFTVALITSLICFMLAVVWLLFPVRLLQVWQVPYTKSAGLLARRSAALFLGLAVMFFMARHASPSPLRSDLSSGIVVACALLAGLGIVEFAAKRAGPAIWLAIVTETAIAAAFMLV